VDLDPLEISPYGDRDEQALFAAYAAVVEEGGAFPRRPPIARSEFRSAWLEGMAAVWVARFEGRLAGSYFLRPAFPGAVTRIANAGYLVPVELRGKGIGRRLCEHSLRHAGERGFDAMLFNLVLEHNPSRRLWERLGFRQVGRIPEAVDGAAALVYWRSLAR
jgi:ribosomal protein S18 acetylase RimI-like enzyme